MMTTYLAIDDDLVAESVKAGRHKTKKEAVTAALKMYTAHKKQMAILSLFATIDFDETYNYKRARGKRHPR